MGLVSVDEMEGQSRYGPRGCGRRRRRSGRVVDEEGSRLIDVGGGKWWKVVGSCGVVS